MSRVGSLVSRMRWGGGAGRGADDPVGEPPAGAPASTIGSATVAPEEASKRERGGFSLAYKILLVFLVVAGAFVWVGFEYQALSVAQHDARARAEAADAFDESVKRAYVAFLDARREEKELPLYRLAIAIDSHSVFMDEVERRLDDLSTRATLDTLTRRIGELSAEVGQYRSLMLAFSDAWSAVGLNDTEGLRAELIGASGQLDAIAFTIGDPRLNEQWSHVKVIEARVLGSQASFLAERGSLRELFAESMRELRIVASSLELVDELRERLTRGMDGYAQTLGDYLEAFEEVKRIEFQMLDTVQIIAPLFDSLRTLVTVQRGNENEAVELAIGKSTTLFVSVLLAAGVIIGLALIVLGFTVLRPVRTIDRTVRQVAQGDLDARTRLTGSDELGRLGRAFDNLLDERVGSLAKAQRENEQLNESVIAMLESVARIARKDLSVRVPVREDITGPIADSLNLLTRETSKVLRDVTEVADDVAATAARLRVGAEEVSGIAEKEKKIVEHTGARLNESAQAMFAIAKLAQECNTAAQLASQNTEAAQGSVAQTGQGMDEIRETINETSKRIKRLGERSQEIGTVVNVIGGIAERTHGLALNASMQAAAAGEAGRGLAVVADEVQRLAENARDATTQVAALVHNIQAETAEASTAMNEAVAQVVSGTQLSSRAARDMEVTKRNADMLARAVGNIARVSRTQTDSVRKLVAGAVGIRRGAEETTTRLGEQASSTARLVAQSEALRESVRQFKLAEIRQVGVARLPAPPGASGRTGTPDPGNPDPETHDPDTPAPVAEVASA